MRLYSGVRVAHRIGLMKPRHLPQLSQTSCLSYGRRADASLNESKVVFVKNLPDGYFYKPLKSLMGAAGPIDSVDVDEPQRTAVVRFWNADSCSTAIDMFNGAIVKDHKISVTSTDPVSSSRMYQDIIVPPEASATVIVNNIRPGVKWQVLKDYLSLAGGRIVSVHLTNSTEESDSDSLNRATVVFSSPLDATRAMLRFHGTQFRGHPLNMAYASLDDVERAPLVTQSLHPRSPSLDSEGNSTSVFVYNLNYDLTWNALHAHFSIAAPVLRATMNVSAEHRKSHGIITFATAEDARRAVESMHGTLLNGRPVMVRLALSATERERDRDEQNRQAAGRRDELSGRQLYVDFVPRHMVWQQIKDGFVHALGEGDSNSSSHSSGAGGDFKVELRPSLAGSWQQGVVTFRDSQAAEEARRVLDGVVFAHHRPLAVKMYNPLLDHRHDE